MILVLVHCMWHISKINLSSAMLEAKKVWNKMLIRSRIFRKMYITLSIKCRTADFYVNKFFQIFVVLKLAEGCKVTPDISNGWLLLSNSLHLYLVASCCISLTFQLAVTHHHQPPSWWWSRGDLLLDSKAQIVSAPKLRLKEGIWIKLLCTCLSCKE